MSGGYATTSEFETLMGATTMITFLLDDHFKHYSI